MHLNHQQRLGLITLVMALALVAFTWPNGRLAPRAFPSASSALSRPR